MASLSSAVQVAVLLSYLVLAARIARQKIYASFAVLLLFAAYCSATSMILLSLPASGYAELWWKIQLGIIAFHVAIAFDVAHKSREGFPRLGPATIGILGALLIGSCLLAYWPGTVSARSLSLSRPVLAVVTAKQYIDSAIAIWCGLVALFYAVAAARGERPNVRAYRWSMIGLFGAQGLLYLALIAGVKIRPELASIPALVTNLALTVILSARGNIFIPLQTHLSGLSVTELERLYSEQPHIKR